MLGGRVALLAPLDPGSAVVARCWELVDQGADIDLLVEALTRGGLRAVPGFALARWADSRLEVIVRGAAVITTPHESITAEGIRTWVERSIDPMPDTISLQGVEGAGPALSVNGGIVLAGSLMITLAGPAPAPPSDLPPELASPDDARATPGGDPSATAPEPAPESGRDSEQVAARVVPQQADAARDDAAAAMWVQSPVPVPLAPDGPVLEDPGPNGPPGSPRVPPQPTGAARQVIEEVPWNSDPHAPLPPATAPAQPDFGQPQPPRPPVQHSQGSQDGAPEGHTINRPALEGAGPGGHHVPTMDGPMVPAARCPHGHLNPPYAAYCRVCGTPVPPQDPVLTPRPALGILRLSTGDIVPLDRGVVMGRNPRIDDRDPGAPHIVKLPSPTNDISRSHVEVSLDEWHVVVADLNSTNGTTVTPPGQQPVRLRPHEPIPIEPNTEVNLADEVVFRFEVTE